jgi:etoposide-induced 2.4 mRNA
MHPSPYIPIRLHIFAPVILLNDCIVSVLNLCMRRHPGTRSKTLSPDRGVGTGGRMEEGEDEDTAVELRPLRHPPALRQTVAARRKLD